MHSWRVLILPFIGEQKLFDQYDFTQPWNSKANQELATAMPSIYAFHGNHRPGTVTTNYLAVVGKDTLWPGASARTTKEVTDQHSTTIMVVENSGEKIHWMEPRDLQFDSMSFVVNSPHGVSSKYLAPAVIMLNNSLRRLEANLPKQVLRALLTVDGGESITSTGDSWHLLSDGRLRSERSIPDRE